MSPGKTPRRTAANQGERLQKFLSHAGVASRSYTPGPYAPDERGVEFFVNWYLDRVSDAGEDAGI